MKKRNSKDKVVKIVKGYYKWHLVEGIQNELYQKYQLNKRRHQETSR